MSDVATRTIPSNGVIKATLVLFVLACLITAVSFFTGWFSLSFGYRTIELGSGGQASAQGTQLMGLPFLLAGATLCIAAILLAQAIYKVSFGRPLGAMPSLALGGLLYAALLLFFPQKDLVELRAYQSPAYSTLISLGETSGSFAGLDVHLDTYPDLQTCADSAGPGGCPTYECVGKRDWWLGKVHVQRQFYPLLEEENASELLKSRCRQLNDYTQVLEEHLPQMDATRPNLPPLQKPKLPKPSGIKF